MILNQEPHTTFPNSMRWMQRWSRSAKINIEVVRKFAEVDYRFKLEVETGKEMIEQYTKLFLAAAQVK